MKLKINGAFRRASKIALAAAVGSGALVGSAHAAIDTTAVTAAMTDAGAAVAVVGAAYLVVKVGTRVFKWVASAF